MKRTILLSISLAAISLTVQAGDMYRWKDASGVVHYSDTPTEGATRIEGGNYSGDAEPGVILPYATRLAQQNFPVTLYVATGCDDVCGQARNLLIKRGIPFNEKLLRTKDEIDKFRKVTGKDIVPTLAVGKSHLNGFQAELWHGELDLAGYPKVAPYGAVNIQPVVIAKPATANKPLKPEETQEPSVPVETLELTEPADVVTSAAPEIETEPEPEP